MDTVVNKSDSPQSPDHNSETKSEEKANALILENYLDDLLRGTSHVRSRQDIPEFGRKKNSGKKSSVKIDKNTDATVEQPVLADRQTPVSDLPATLADNQRPSAEEQYDTAAPSAVSPHRPTQAERGDFQQSVSPEMNANKQSREYKPAPEQDLNAQVLQQLEAKLAAVEAKNTARELEQKNQQALLNQAEQTVAEDLSLEQVAEQAIEQPLDSPAEKAVAHSDNAVQSLQEIETLNFSMSPDAWASQGVECMVCDVAGLKLALPLPQLGVVYELQDDDEVKPLFGQQDWYLGLVKTATDKMQVIDSASFIMPERNISLKEQGYKYLIRLAGSPWALACQGVDETINLNVDDIKWRKERGARPWLAGTIIEKMCALLDVEGLLQLVDESTN